MNSILLPLSDTSLITSIINFILNTLAAMVGGRDCGDITAYQTVSRHLISIIFGGMVLLLASHRYQGTDRALKVREQLLVWGFSIAMLREFAMLGLKSLAITGAVTEMYLESIYPIVGHYIRVCAEIIISGAFLSYYAPKNVWAKLYIKAGLTLYTLLTLGLLSLGFYFAPNPVLAFSESATDISWHLPVIGLMLSAFWVIAYTGITKHVALLTSLSFFIAAHCLSIVNSLAQGSYDYNLVPIMYGFDVWAIPILGLMYIKEQQNLIDSTYQHALAYEKLRADDNQTIIQGISHELRSPMAGLVGLLHAYQRKFIKLKTVMGIGTSSCESCANKKLLSEIFGALISFQTIVSNLSDILTNLSDYGKCIRQHSSSPQDIRVLLLRAVDFIRFADNSKKLDFKSIEFVDLSPKVDAIVNIAPSKFLQIIQNIAENAITAVKEKPNNVPKITISLQVLNLSVLVKIVDNGIGIPKDKIPRCGEREYTTGRAKGNTGLGLYFVNTYLHEIEGALKIKSVEGEGTTMSLYFPKVAANKDIPV